MAETLVENRVCHACGADVRPNTLFCYNCGKSVAPEIVNDLPDRKDIGNARLGENLPEEKNGGDAGEIKQAVVENAADKPLPKPDLSVEPPLKSAAAMRRKSKSFQPKQVEIIWEEHENAPNGWFIFAAILLTLFAVGVLFLAIRLR